jgi:hypothetical protein
MKCKSVQNKFLTLLTGLFLLSCNTSESKKAQNMSTISSTKSVSISINKSKDDAYKFASNAENFPKWIAFMKSMSKKSENVWIAETDSGKIEIEMTPQNDFGIIDHLVKLPDGTIVSNPLRVIKNGSQSEVVFTLFKMPNKTDQDFENDSKLVETDLKSLKRILESN